MSGTSLDGLDICFVKFSQKNSMWNFEILQAETIPYTPELKEILKNSVALSAEELLALHSEYGFYLGRETQKFITKYSLHNIDLIASHGHTAFHQPNRKFTCQIGDGRAITIETGLPVVYDFRSQDVLLGGNGAPLVPIGDELLFGEYDACLNLGGFSNISFKKSGERIAFDIAPVNIVLNKISQDLGKNYDENGDLARKGTVDRQLLEELNKLEFYHHQHPKSLGVEFCNQYIFPLLQNTDSITALSTFTEHSAVQISKIFNDNNLKKVLFTGGGTYNSYLIEKIKSKTSSEIIIPEKTIIDFKEALIFAFMGVLRMNNEINVLASATGSLRNHSSGIIV